MLFMIGEQELLDGRMTKSDCCPTHQKTDQAPGKEVRRYEQKAGCNEKKEENGRG